MMEIEGFNFRTSRSFEHFAEKISGETFQLLGIEGATRSNSAALRSREGILLFERAVYDARLRLLGCASELLKTRFRLIFARAGSRWSPPVRRLDCP